jgi:MerR family transcriptional regulator, light-induced transcriptional regulator
MRGGHMSLSDQNQTNASCFASIPSSDTERSFCSDIFEALSGVESDTTRRTQLVRTIEAEIIPRLMLMHSGPNAPSLVAAKSASETKAVGHERTAVESRVRSSRPDHGIDEMDIGAFNTILVEKDIATARSYIDGLLRDGMDWEDLLLNVMQPAARRLGEDWKEDRRDFTEVTLGLGMLQQVLRESNPLGEKIPRRVDENRRIFLAAIPGEQHTFGLLMVEDFFRRAGWDVHIEAAASVDGLTEVVKREWYSAVGFTMGTEAQAEVLRPLIAVLRKGSRNPSMGILVGGPAFVEQPGLAEKVGADALAVDGLQALVEADRITRQAQRAG